MHPQGRAGLGRVSGLPGAFALRPHPALPRDAPAAGAMSTDATPARSGRPGASTAPVGQPKRVLRLDELTPAQRRLVLALIELGGAKPRIVRLANLDPITREIVVSILRARKNARAALDFAGR